METSEIQKIAAMRAEYDKEMKAYHDNCDRSNDRVLKAIRKVKGDQFHNDLIDVIKWAEPSGMYELVSEPSGNMQEEDYQSIQRVWVDQWSVGDSGDSFSGYVYVKLKLGMWFKMYYEC